MNDANLDPPPLALEPGAAPCDLELSYLARTLADERACRESFRHRWSVLVTPDRWLPAVLGGAP
jgi:hypothetical protein